MKKILFATLCAAVLVASGPIGCVQDNIPAERGGTSSAGVVQWPALQALDNLAHRIDHLIEDGEAEALADLARSLRETALQVANDTVPSGARNPEQVRVLQADLRSLAEALADAEALGGEALTSAMAPFGAITHRLMQQAGVPHTHGHHDHHQDHGDDHPMTLADLEELEGPGPYGGTILEIVDDHLVHGEMVLDPETGNLRIYTLDEVEEPTTLDDPLSAELVFDGWTSSGDRVRVTLYPDSSQLSFGHLEGFDEKLKGVEWIAGRVTGRMRAGGTVRSIDGEAGWPPDAEVDGHNGHEH